MLRSPKRGMPNASTIAAMRQLDAGNGKRFADAEALFKDLGISLEQQVQPAEQAERPTPRFRRIGRK